MLYSYTYSRWIKIAILLAVAQPAIASPIRLSHQGRILDASGEPLDGEHQVEARFANEGGDTLWSDSFTTTFRGGYYHLVLGDAAPLEGALFQGGRPTLWLTVDAGSPMEVDGPLAHVPYAAVADWAERSAWADTATNVSGGVVNASSIRVDGREVAVQGTATEFTSLRVEQGLQLGAAVGLECGPANRGRLRYPLGGPAEVCGGTGWTALSAPLDATCNIVDECPTSGEVSRVMLSDVGFISGLGVELFCARYDSTHGQIGYRSDDVTGVPCLRYTWGVSVTRGAGGASFPMLEEVGSRAIIGDVNVAMPLLNRVGENLMLERIAPTSTFPSLQAAGGDVMFSFDSSPVDGSPLAELFPSLEYVGGQLAGPEAGSPVPIPNLVRVEGDYRAPTISAPQLQHIGGKLTGPDAGPPVPMPNLLHVGGDYTAPTVSAPALREVGGTVTLIGPQPELPALETVGGLILGQPGANYSWEMTAAPFPLDSLASLRRIDGNLSIRCVIGWNQPEIDAFIDRVGRANITGTITTRTYDHCRMTN